MEFVIPAGTADVNPYNGFPLIVPVPVIVAL